MREVIEGAKERERERGDMVASTRLGANQNSNHTGELQPRHTRRRRRGVPANQRQSFPRKKKKKKEWQTFLYNSKFCMPRRSGQGSVRIIEPRTRKIFKAGVSISYTE